MLYLKGRGEAIVCRSIYISQRFANGHGLRSMMDCKFVPDSTNDTGDWGVRLML